MDPATGGVLIGGLKALYEMAKANQDPKMMGQLLEIQGQVFDLVNENQSLREENARQTGALIAREQVELRPDGAIWRKTDLGSELFGGFCPNCHSESGKLLKLSISPSDNVRSCTVCKFYADRTKWWD